MEEGEFRIGDFVKVNWSNVVLYGTVVQLGIHKSIVYVKLFGSGGIVSENVWNVDFATDQEYAAQVIKKTIK